MNEQQYLAAVKKLNELTAAYDEGKPLVSDKEWDDLYFQVQSYEKEHGAINNSPTTSIQQVSSRLKKVKHSHPMLSLAKTKSLDEVKSFVKGQSYIVMQKLDGLTCSLKYENGKLVQAETRGNGTIGEDITHNALVIDSIPNEIDNFTGTVDGEVLCSYADFEKTSGFKNPRNYAAGSIRLVDANECKDRKLTFVAWDLIEDMPSLEDKLKFLSQHFIVVKYQKDVLDIDEMKKGPYPIDGLVIKYNDTAFYKSKGQNGHHPLGAIAFKFYDELYTTILNDIKWQVGRTGKLTPIAEFDPVDIDGTTVRRASLHNVDRMQDIFAGLPRKGQLIKVFKANQIIPQVHSADLSYNGTEIPLPTVCPNCGSPLHDLVCTNNCTSKFPLFVSRLGVEGLSTKTLEKLVEYGWLNRLVDIFKLKDHREEWIAKDGFNKTSVDKILSNIEQAKKIEDWKLLSAIGIPNIQAANAKKILSNMSIYDLPNGNYDIGPVGNEIVRNYDYAELKEVLPYVDLVKVDKKNLSFAITGKTSNRKKIVKYLEDNGYSINSKPDVLICNEPSNSSKYKSAIERNIPIITEEQFWSKY